jgi:hypothetical protein
MHLAKLRPNHSDLCHLVIYLVDTIHTHTHIIDIIDSIGIGIGIAHPSTQHLRLDMSSL